LLKLLLRTTWLPERFATPLLKFIWSPKHFHCLSSLTTWLLPVG
jgi:hypothetical protein